MSDFLRSLAEKSTDPIRILGFVGQGVFFLRFVIQWIVSERRKESVIPEAFWWVSIVGGTMTLVYGFLIHEPPVILGQLFANVVYVRNLMLVRQREARMRAAVEQAGSPNA